MSGDRLSRAEAVVLVQRIMDGDYADDDELSDWLASLTRSLSCPHVADFIFWPEAGEPTAAEVVDQSLEYQAIVLGP